jgi:predicted nicotinamide N-methyase
MGDIPASLPPTLFLPPIRQIANRAPADLSYALELLSAIYVPPIRGTRRIGHRRVFGPPDGTPITAHLPVDETTACDSEAEALRLDSFERAYALRWLTALIGFGSEPETNVPEAVLSSAAALLALCAGTAAAGGVARRFTFELGPDIPSTAREIVVHLVDAPLDNGDFSSVGAQTWGAACVLSGIIARSPSTFGLGGNTGPLRALELGAGTGLVSLALAKVLATLGDAPHAANATLVATDFYPVALANLRANIARNYARTPDRSPPVLVRELDWATFGHSASADAILAAPFDLILGADIVYEPEHARWVRGVVERTLRLNVHARFHLVIYSRPTHAHESSAAEREFPLGVTTSKHAEDPCLVTLSKDIIECEDEVGFIGRTLEYAHYIIGWGQPHAL